MRKRSCSRVSEMLSRNAKVPHLVEIYPGASDLHTPGMRTNGLQGYPALAQTLLYYLHVTAQAEHTLKKEARRRAQEPHKLQHRVGCRDSLHSMRKDAAHTARKDGWPHSTAQSVAISGLR